MQIESPPLKPMKLRKKLVALNAMARPSTTQSALRSPLPPSENAMPKPSPTMENTPTAFATGPVSDWRSRLSGPSHGMPALLASASPAPNSATATMRESDTSVLRFMAASFRVR